MKVKVTFKTPDALDNALDDCDLEDEEWEDAEEICKEWIQYGEYVTIEIDTDRGTATVIKA